MINKTSTQTKAATYQQAGVNIEQADRLVGYIKNLTQRKKFPGVLAGIGGFGALFEVPLGYKEPVLVSGTDGVGTKLKLAVSLNKHDTIGIDLVAMCVNDIITLGAKPLFFLDYFATGKLEQDQARSIIAGINQGCEQSDMPLIGGETAEMPGVYQGSDYDLAGFCVGIVEKKKIIDGSRIQPGDQLIGIASSGIHSNGYSLVRHIIDTNQVSLDQPFENRTLGDCLLTPTRIYVKPLLDLMQHVDVLAMAHITGGGIVENLPRVLPNKTRAIINTQSWQQPEIFHWLQKAGNIPDQDMYRTFNLGVGMIVCVKPDAVSQTLKILTHHGEKAWLIGQIEASNEDKPKVVI